MVWFNKIFLLEIYTYYYLYVCTQFYSVSFMFLLQQFNPEWASSVSFREHSNNAYCAYVYIFLFFHSRPSWESLKFLYFSVGLIVLFTIVQLRRTYMASLSLFKVHVNSSKRMHPRYPLTCLSLLIIFFVCRIKRDIFFKINSQI